MNEVFDIAVIGGGPAGFSAALNGKARGKTVLVIGNPIEENPLYSSKQIDNYLGMGKVTGKVMLDAFQAHALDAGAEWHGGRVVSVLKQGDLFYIGIGSDMVTAKSLVIATGILQTSKLKGEMELIGRGVSWCATCDGMLYRGKSVAVIGTAKHAAEEANFLQEIGCRVTYVSSARPEKLREDISFLDRKSVV